MLRKKGKSKGSARNRYSVRRKPTGKFKERKDDERFRQIVRVSGIGIFDHDHLSDTIYFSPEQCKIFGWGPDEKVTLQKITAQIHPEDRERVINAIQMAHDPSGHGRLDIDHRIILEDGTIRWLSARSQTFFKGKSAARHPVRTVGAVLDITERKRMEEELLKVQKLESLGVLAGGIAHDFNNFLTGIMGNISLAKDLGSPDDILNRLTAAEKASLRAKELARQLLTFSKGGIPVKKPSSFKELLEHSVQFALTGSRVQSRFTFDEDLWTVEIDEGQMSQVVQNLVINAQQAMPEGGTIQVFGKNMTIESDQFNEVPFKKGNYVKISFKDSGVGIQKNHLSKIFDPYFTTKQKGSGLGLSISFSIIRKHDGYLTVESTPGKGTTFHIFLPASSRKPLSDKEREEVKRGRGRILVIDDEESVLDVAGEMIRRLEYHVDVALSGQEGLQKFTSARKSGSSFDAVITDLTLPGDLSGIEILNRLKAQDRRAKVIVSSGYSHDPVIADFRTYGFSGMIVKPYRIFELSAILNHVINLERSE